MSSLLTWLWVITSFRRFKQRFQQHLLNDSGLPPLCHTNTRVIKSFDSVQFLPFNFIFIILVIVMVFKISVLIVKQRFQQHSLNYLSLFNGIIIIVNTILFTGIFTSLIVLFFNYVLGNLSIVFANFDNILLTVSWKFDPWFFFVNWLLPENAKIRQERKWCEAVTLIGKSTLFNTREC